MLRKGSTGRLFLATPSYKSPSYSDQFKCRSIMCWNRLLLAVIRTASSVTDIKIMLDEQKKISIETGIFNAFWEL